jgi:hypothetical protein
LPRLITTSHVAIDSRKTTATKKQPTLIQTMISSSLVLLLPISFSSSSVERSLAGSERSDRANSRF